VRSEIGWQAAVPSTALPARSVLVTREQAFDPFHRGGHVQHDPVLPAAARGDNGGPGQASGRHILAQYDERTVVVYQAYLREIAECAVQHERFGGPAFSPARMSWVKPNFLWMMFRSGWGTKPGQETTLAMRITREAFDQILAEAVPSTFTPETYEHVASGRRRSGGPGAAAMGLFRSALERERSSRSGRWPRRLRRTTLELMKHPLKARVHNGRLVLDEPTDLPEGAEVELVAVDDDFDSEERARLLAALDEGIEDFERSDHVDGFELIAQMRAAREAAGR
jgi:hypothetical protein